MPTPMEKLAELEARAALKDSHQDAKIEGLQKELHELKDKIGELIILLETIKSFVKIVGYAEKFFVFMGKVTIWIGGIYAVYKFGLTELAQKVREAGGK